MSSFFPISLLFSVISAAEQFQFDLDLDIHAYTHTQTRTTL